MSLPLKKLPAAGAVALSHTPMGTSISIFLQLKNCTTAENKTVGRIILSQWHAIFTPSCYIRIFNNTPILTFPYRQAGISSDSIKEFLHSFLRTNMPMHISQHLPILYHHSFCFSALLKNLALFQINTFKNVHFKSLLIQQRRLITWKKTRRIKKTRPNN